MAVTRRGYIFGAFVSGVLCVLLIIVAISSDSWIVSKGYTNSQDLDSSVTYGLFRGEFTSYILSTPSINPLYMKCIPEIGACAVSCKTTSEAREQEVRALAEGFRPNLVCASVTVVNTVDPLDTPPVISFGIYVAVLTILFLQLAFAVTAAILAIINATKNPTEPVFGLPGCLWTNVVAAKLGLLVMLIFGIYWATSGLQEHLAFAYIALGSQELNAGLGFSYWLLIGAIICSITNVELIQLRRYLLERDPPPPTIKLENHSDGTVFLY